MKNTLLIPFLMALSSSVQLNSQSVSELLPHSVDGWIPQGPDKIYTSENLYDYINGGAELYLSYGMKEVVSRIITEGDNEIRVEIFDMIEAKNAFGVFTHTRTHDEMKFGQGSQYFTGAQIFWKNNFFVAITANNENESIQKAISYIAAEIDNNIAQGGEIPAIISLLPEDGLETDGYIYFHHYIWLNSYFYIASDNILGIEPESDAVLAKYGTKDSRYYLLIIEYLNVKAASDAQKAFRKHFLDSEDSIQAIEDGSWLGAGSMDTYLIAVFNGNEKESVTELLNEVKKKITKP